MEGSGPRSCVSLTDRLALFFRLPGLCVTRKRSRLGELLAPHGSAAKL